MEEKIKEKKFKKILIFIISIYLIVYSVSAEITWPAFNVCCEKTKNGAWCQNTPEENCDLSINPLTKAPYRKTPASCDATSFCKMGCCVDTSEGLCMENTPQKVCELYAGTWFDDNQCNIQQCKLGCCILGDQASFVTLTRCKKLSSIYGLETNFRKDITSESACIALANAQDKGACVYELDGERTCKFTTRGECLNAKKSANITKEPEFFKDYLCSADELGTNCGPTTETMCVEGKDEVYFKDTCGNPANIYDANRIYSKDPGYWKKVVPKSQSCGFNNKDGNINSKNCGNCNYLQGSLCGKGSASYGDNICKDLNCYNTQNGKNYKNGESWCEYQGEVGNGNDLVGSRHFRHICINGEEIIEPCADYRNEVCYESKIAGTDFTEAACRVNRWKDCIDQFNEKDCLNSDKRDCFWLNGSHYDGSASNVNKNTNTSSNPEKADTSQTENRGILNGGGICLPNYPPGLKFWEGSEAKAICSLGNSRQVIHYELNIFGGKKCKENCEVYSIEWVKKLNRICSSLGDCGIKSNLVGKSTDDGVVVKVNGTVISGIMEKIKESSNK